MGPDGGPDVNKLRGDGWQWPHLRLQFSATVEIEQNK